MLMKLHSEEDGCRTQQYDTINRSERQRQPVRAQQFIIILNNIRFRLFVAQPNFRN
jgi:hypothetical protein